MPTDNSPQFVNSITPQNPEVLCKDPQHQTLAQQLYKRTLEVLDEKKHSENLLYNISEAVITVKIDYKINIINKAAEELLNMPIKEVEGKDLKNILILETEDGQKVQPETYCFQSADVEMRNLVYVINGVTKYLKLQSTTIKNPQGEVECVITITDVTRERLLEKSKDEFISVASHELRTPMTIIKSYLWMLEAGKGGELNERQKDYLSKASGGVERMLSMINDTLNTSKIDQGKIELRIEEVDIREYLDDFVPDFLLKTQEKGLEFIVDVSEKCKSVYCDKVKFREILTNLIGNSIKFTSAGYIKLCVNKFGDSFIRFEISDTGKGVAEGDIQRLFHKFGRVDNSFQTVAESGGTGLGLYIVKNLVENMGGKVGAESLGIGKGSTFWFTLPGEYYEVPEKFRGYASLTLAPLVETKVTSICPI